MFTFPILVLTVWKWLSNDNNEKALLTSLKSREEALTTSWKRTSQSTEVTNKFIFPQADNFTTDYSQNLVLINGSVVTLKWSNNSTNFDLLVGASADDGISSIGLAHYDNITESFQWTVTTAGMPKSDMYYVTIDDLDGSEFGSTTFNSNLFNISAKAAASPSKTASSPLSLSTSQPAIEITSISSIVTSSTPSSSLTAAAVTSSTSSPPPPSSSSSSASTKAEISLGVLLGLVLLAVFCWFCWWFYRKSRRISSTDNPKSSSMKSESENISQNSEGAQPFEMEGPYTVLIPPREMMGDSTQPREVDGDSVQRRELYGGPREPEELDGWGREVVELDGRR